MQVRQLSHAQDELDVFKGRDSWKYLSSGRRLALAGHCNVRLVLILLLMGRQVFSKPSEKRYHRTPAETLRALVKSDVGMYERIHSTKVLF